MPLRKILNIPGAYPGQHAFQEQMGFDLETSLSWRMLGVGKSKPQSPRANQVVLLESEQKEKKTDIAVIIIRVLPFHVTLLLPLLWFTIPCIHHLAASAPTQNLPLAQPRTQSSSELDGSH